MAWLLWLLTEPDLLSSRARDLPGESRSFTTTDMNDKLAPIHPGEVLMEDFRAGFDITQNKLAVSMGVPPRRINEIVHATTLMSPRIVRRNRSRQSPLKTA